MTEVSYSDFKDITGLLGHTELQMFFPELGLSPEDIEKAEYSASTSDVNLRARNVLRKWHQKNGLEATREAVLQALNRCEYNMQWKTDREMEFDR